MSFYSTILSSVTANGDCNDEIKRLFLLERKDMTNLDSIIKSRDTTLLTKICLVSAMVFPVVMYGCESWTYLDLDSIIKSRDITLPTKMCLVSAMVFPVVMYVCESWTIKS